MVPLEPWHFDFFMRPDEADPIAGRAMGRTLIADDGTPLGFGGVYFDENTKGDVVIVAFFYGGPNQYFAHKYITMVLRGMIDSIRTMQEMGITQIYCVADRRIPGSEKFVEWLGAELVPDGEDPNGAIYLIKFDKIKLLNR